MPEPFEQCVRRGGRVRTITLPGGRYMHVCFLGGRSYAGEVKKRKRGAQESLGERFRR